jgi:heptosyltransferase-2
MNYDASKSSGTRVMKKIAIFLPNWVGDAVMATPTLRALRANLQADVELIGIGKPAVTGVLESTPWINSYWPYRARSRGPLPGRRGIVRRLREAQVDVAILFPNSLSTAAMAWLGGVRRRIGYARDGRSFLLTDRLYAPRSGRKWLPVPAVDYYLKLIEPLGFQSANRKMELACSADDLKLYHQLMNHQGLSLSKDTIVINNGGAFGGSKLWPQDHVYQLAKKLVEQNDIQILLHCGPDEREAANSIANRLNHPAVKSMGSMPSLPMGLSKAVLGSAQVVISTDSGPRHIALALDRPVISLFGPTDVAWTTTYNEPETALSEPTACAPCWKKTCPLGHHACMVNLTVEKVYAATVKKLALNQSRTAVKPLPQVA